MQDFKFYFGLGWEHILSWDALDHLLFIIALTAIYLLKNWKQVLILVTAFTIGHSVTLILSVLDIVRFSPEWVEFLIPCTIVITAFSNFFQKEFTPHAVRLNYFMALFFGLIHGMGFANTIRFMLAKNQGIAMGLFGFNVGLEAGQIIVVVIILLMSYFIINILKINRREWVLVISGAVLGIALKMVVERIPV